MEVSNLVKHSQGSLIRVMFNEAMKYKDVISFALGQPDFRTPEAIVEEGVKQFLAGKTYYTPNMGVIELRKAIADYYKDTLNPDPLSQIIVTCGATEALQLAMFTLLNPGDELIVFVPAFANYFGQVGMTGAKCVQVPTYEENNFSPSIEDFKNAITDRTKVVLLNSPSNPTGNVIDAETLKEIAKIAVEKDLWVISDEIYSKLIYGNKKYTSILEFEGMKERTVYISGFSKMFSMTGWRVGYAIGPTEVITGMIKCNENILSCLPEPNQLAAAYALLHCEDEIEKMRKVYEHRRDLICELLKDVPGVTTKVPDGAFYVFPNVKELCKRTGLNSLDLCMDILRKNKVVLVPGTAFGDCGEGYVRISYATSDEAIIEGVKRFKAYAEDVFSNT